MILSESKTGHFRQKGFEFLLLDVLDPDELAYISILQ